MAPRAAGTKEPPCPAPDLPGREERQELGEGAPLAGSGGMGGGGDCAVRFALTVGDEEKCVSFGSTVYNANEDMHLVFCLPLLKLAL